MKKNYRWGILGPGRIADKFCTALSVTEGAEVYAIASRDMERAKSFGSKYNAPKIYDNYEDLVNDDQVDVVYIATPHSFHYEQAMLCLRANKAVVCEKPMSLTYRDTAMMIDVATQHKVFLMEGLWTACMPFIDKIKELIAAGIIGELQYVAADFGFDAIKDMDSRLYNKVLGGSAVLDIGVYPLSLATLILGEPSAIKAVTRLAPTGVDEYANIVLQYAGGATAHALCTLNFATPTEAMIIGTKGTIKIKNPWFKATDFSLHLHDGTKEEFSVPHKSNGFEHEIMEVMQCLDSGLLQSEKWPHNLTLSVSKIMDEVLQQAGVVYE